MLKDFILVAAKVKRYYAKRFTLHVYIRYSVYDKSTTVIVLDFNRSLSSGKGNFVATVLNVNAIHIIYYVWLSYMQYSMKNILATIYIYYTYIMLNWYLTQYIGYFSVHLFFGFVFFLTKKYMCIRKIYWFIFVKLIKYTPETY